MTLRCMRRWCDVCKDKLASSSCVRCDRDVCWDHQHDYICTFCRVLDEELLATGQPIPNREPPSLVWTNPRNREWWIRWGLVVVVTYVCGSWMSFQFRHPELTQVQAFLSFWDAMTWR